MLFDLRRRGRRRTVKVIYVGLALLMGVGLVGFGVGTGGGSGGLVNGLVENEKNGREPTYEKQVSAALKATRKHPSDPAGWAALTKARLRESSGSEYFDSSAEQFTPKGKELLEQVANSWDEYLKLNPDHPSSRLANEVLLIFSKEGLNRPSEAVRALQILIAAKAPTEALYVDLAEYAYLADELGEGELAAEKAVALAPKAERKTLKKDLENAKVKEIEKMVKEHNPKVSPSTTGSGTVGSLTQTSTG